MTKMNMANDPSMTNLSMTKDPGMMNPGMTFKSVFCILMAALFRRSARVRQPVIGKFLFHDG